LSSGTEDFQQLVHDQPFWGECERGQAADQAAKVGAPQSTECRPSRATVKSKPPTHTLPIVEPPATIDHATVTIRVARVSVNHSRRHKKGSRRWGS
jgi:hypothetical protein